jgi:hypothetical protein
MTSNLDMVFLSSPEAALYFSPFVFGFTLSGVTNCLLRGPTLPFSRAAVMKKEAAQVSSPGEPIGGPMLAADAVVREEEAAWVVFRFDRTQARIVRSPKRILPRGVEVIALRVRPETSRWIAEFSEHEAD